MCQRALSAREPDHSAHDGRRAHRKLTAGRAGMALRGIQAQHPEVVLAEAITTRGRVMELGIWEKNVILKFLIESKQERKKNKHR